MGNDLKVRTAASILWAFAVGPQMLETYDQRLLTLWLILGVVGLAIIWAFNVKESK